MANGLGGLAQGLRLAGGVLSPRVFEAEAQMESQRERQMQTQRLAEITQTVRGIESGAIEPEAGQTVLKQLGFNAPVGPGPEAIAKKEAMAQRQAMAEAMSKLPPNATFEDRLTVMGPFMTPEQQLKVYDSLVNKQAQLDLRREQVQQQYELKSRDLTRQEDRDAAKAAQDALMAQIAADNAATKRMMVGVGGGNKDLQREMLELRIEGEKAKQAQKAAGKMLPPKVVQDLAEEENEAKRTIGLGTSFEDRFAGVKGAAAAAAGQYLPGVDTDSTSWWKDYRKQEIVMRNKIFGSALTDSEKKAWAEANVSPTMQASVIRQNLKSRASLEAKAFNAKINRLGTSGYDVSGFEQVNTKPTTPALPQGWKIEKVSP